MKPWKVLGSKVLIEDQWIKVRADDCETAQGVSVAPYYVVEYPDWVHVIPVDAAGRIMVIEQYRHGIGEDCVEYPGGAVDRSDADPLSAARRELLEETGYASKRIEKLCTLVPNSAVHNNLIHAFIAYDIEKVAEPNLGGGEEIEFRFLTVDQLLAQIEAGKFRQAFYLASTLYALKKMGRLR